MKQIWKYIFVGYPGYRETTFDMPKDAKVFTVQAQGNDLCLWALVDPAAIKVGRKFVVFGTGWDIDFVTFALNYVGTAQVDGLVWHVFEEI